MTNSTITEERVVGLRFDNKDFAKSVRSTMSLLDRLHYSVENLKGAGNSVLFFANQIKSITFDPLARGCQMGIGKIMALTAALTGVSNVADEVYHKMTTLVKSMSTDQISAGWEKYADYTSSIQTIMSATKQEGETDAEAMARVNREMEKLLWFTDETSYNLTDMTSNIGKFTSQGIGLEESVTAMQGIALWAAAAGQRSAEASRVMYNLSQAMGTGYVQLMDWKSVENANMATKEFKELAIKAGLAEGTLKKVGNEIQTLEGTIVTAENLRNTLQDKWLTTDKVLMRVLSEYGSYATKVREYQSANGLDTASEAIEKLKEEGIAVEDQIGQASFEAGQAAITFADTIGSVKDAVSTQFLRIFQAIFGNYLKAKKLWTTLANELWTVFAGPVNEIAIALERFAETGAIEKTWSELYELWKNIYKVFEKIDNTFKDVFPYVGVYIKNFLDGTQKISKTLSSFINNRVLGNEKIWSNLKTFFEGVRSSINIIKNLLDTIYNRILSKFTGKTDSFLEAISNIAAKIGDILVKADAYIQKTDLFNNFFDSIERVVNNVLEGIKQIKKVLSDAIEKVTTKFFPQDTKFDATIETLTAFDNAADLVIGGINGIVDALTLAIPWFVRFWYWIKNTFSDAKKFFGTLGGMIKAVFDEIKRILEPIFGEVGNIFDELSRNFSIAELFNNSQNPIDFFNKLIEKLKEFSGVTNEYLLDLFTNTKADNAFKKIVAILVDNITFLLDELEPLMPRILKLNEQLFKTDSIFATIKLIAENVFATIVFFNILKMLFSKQKVEQASHDQSVSTVFSSGNWVIDLINFIPNITNLLKAIKNLVNPFEKLGEDMKRAAKSIMIFGIVSSIVASLGIMVAAIVAIAVMPWKKVLLALFVITTLEAGIFGIFAVMNKLANKKNFDAKSVLAFGAFMTLFATAMLEMAAAVAIIATIQNDDNVGIAGAVFGLSVLLASMTTIMMLLADAAKNEGQMISAGVAVVLLAKAVKIIASAMVKISHIDEDKLAQSSIVIMALVGLMGILEILAAAIKKQQGGTGAIIVMGISCVAMAGSILVAAFAMKKIADIPLDQLKTAGIAIGIIFAALSAFVVGASGLAKLLTSGNKGTTATLVVLTVMVGVMAGIMTAIGAALATITKNAATSGKIWTAALAIATLMGAVSIVLLLGANMNKANIGAVAAFGGIITAVLTSVAAVGLALGKLAKDVDPASLWNTVGAMAAIMGAIMLIVGVAAFVIQAVGKTSFGKGFIGALFAVSGIIAIMITAFAFLAYSAAKFMDTLIALTNLSDEATAKLTASGGAIVTAIGGVISAIIEGLDKSLTEMLHTTKIPDAFGRFMEKILMTVTGLIPKIKSFIKRVITEISDYVQKNHTMIKELIQTILDDTLDLILDLFEKYWPRITSDAERFLNDIFFRIDRIFDRWTPIIVEDLLNISKAILSVIMQTKIGIVNNVINGILYLLIRLKAFSFQFALMAMEVVHRFTIGFLTSVREKAPEILEELAVTIITIINALADVIDKHHQEFKDAITRLMNSIYSAFSSWFTDADTPGGKLFRIGYNIVAGIMKGLNSGKQMLTTAISNLANNGIIKTFTDKDHLDMHSPSKVFEGFGQYIVDGLVNGITKNQGAVSNVLSNLGGIVKNSFTDTFGDPKDILSNLGNGLMNGITGLISQNFNLNGLLGDMNGLSIVLTPELDLSTLESQAGGISSMFGQQQIDAVVGSFSTPDTGMDSVTMTNKMDEMMQKMEDFAMAQSYNTQTTDVKVTLEGDAKKMLKVLKTESQKQSLASGVPSTI